MSGRVPVRRDQHHRAVAEDVVLAVDHLIVERVVEIDRARAVARHGAGTARRLELRALDEEGRAREELVAAAVVEVEVRVRDVAHVGGREPEARELRHDVVALLRPHAEALDTFRAEPPDGIDARLAVHARVEQQLAARMVDEEAQHRHDPSITRREVGDHARAIDLDGAGAERVDAAHS